MPEHNVISDPDIHEPKGIASASDGEVYVANGAGSGAWTAPGGATFGEMKVINNATTITPGAAADGTLNTDSDYVKVDTGIWVTGSVDGVTFDSSGYLEVTIPGLYEISAWICFKASINNTLTAFKYSIDDTNTTLSPRKLSRLASTASDTGSTAASGFMTLDAGAKISFWVAVDNAAVITPIDAGLTITLLKAS